MSNSGSSYKLNSNENKQVKKKISATRKGVKYAIKCEINYDNEEFFRDAVFAYSEFCIWLLIKKKKNKYAIKESIHIFNIKSIYISDCDTIELRFLYHLVIISSPGVDEIAHLIFPIIYFSTKLHERQIVEISTYSRDRYPLFIPNTSVPQQFQICYDAYCSLYKKPYYHEIVLYFYQMINTENVILDLSYWPYQLLYLQSTNGISFQSFFETATQFKYFIGITCHNANLPLILPEIAAILKTTQSIRFLSLSGIGLTRGGKELGDAIRENKDLDLLSIDLSNNKISDLEYFTESLQYLNKPLYYLNLSNCYLSEIATRNLCRSMMLNKNLQSLKGFEITGAIMNSNLVTFSNFFHESSDSLERVHFGLINTGLDVFTRELNSTHRIYPILESLSLVGTKLDDASINGILLFVGNSKNLKELDLSSTNILYTDLSQIIEEINKNREITLFSLHLNNLGLNGRKLDKVRAALSTNDSSQNLKWKALSLENNALSCNDFCNLITSLSKLSNLTTLNIGMNFDSKSSKGVENYLSNLLTLPRLEKLSLRGSKEKFLTTDMILPFVTSLINSNKTLRLNFKDNKLGSQGYKVLRNLIEAQKVIELQIDGNKPNDINDVYDIIDSVCKHEMIKLFDFPSRDVKKLFPLISKSEQDNVIQKLETKRRTLLERLQDRLVSSGIHSRWTLNGVGAIEDVVDVQTKSLHEYLNRRPTTEHTFACKQHFGRPMPFLEDDINPEQTGILKTITEQATVDVYKLYQVTPDFIEEIAPMSKSLYYRYLEYKQSENCENAYSTLSDIDYLTARKKTISTKAVSFGDDQRIDFTFDARPKSVLSTSATILQNASISINPGSYSSSQEPSDSSSSSD